jgi:hypothetical protein
MFGMRRWLRSNAAKVFVVALLGVQVTPLVQACPMPMTDVSMAFSSTDMPERCAGMAKQACLFSYLQSDQVTASDGAAIATHPAAILRIVVPRFVAPAARAGGGADHVGAPSGAPPPRLLFCRMLE